MKIFRHFLLVLLYCVINGNAETQDFPLRNDPPPMGRPDLSQLQAFESSSDVKGGVLGAVLLDSGDFLTDFSSVSYLEIDTGASIFNRASQDVEEAILILDGKLIVTIENRELELNKGDVAIIPPGFSHGVINRAADTVRLLSIKVSYTEEARQRKLSTKAKDSDISEKPMFQQSRLDRSLMRDSKNSHDGHGPLLFRRLFNTESFVTNWHVMSHAIVLPGSSIGLHQHNTREEVYYVVQGSGKLTGNGHIYNVRAGDAVPCRINGRHGIYNDSDIDLELLVFSVAQEKGNVRFEKNLGDDLIPQ